MASEQSRVTGWLYQQIQGDATLLAAVGGRIYADEAPQSVRVPLVLFAFLGGSDQLTGNVRLSNGLWLIRAVGEGTSYASIEDIADRMDDKVTAVGFGGTFYRDIRILSSVREQPHQRKDAQFGFPTVYLGGFYRIRWSPAL